jgi:membrane-associated PAP2 superfamily phosphatase
MNQHFKYCLIHVLPIFAGLALATLIIAVGNLDLAVSGRFYTETRGWEHGQDLLWAVLHRYGPLPGLLLGAAGLAALLLASLVKSLRRHWKVSAFLILFLALGPGLVVNTIFKENWGRPRPKHIVAFNGQYQYRAVYQPGPKAKLLQSFPSGHAAIGFFVMAPYFPLRRSRRKQALAFLLGGSLYGWLMGVGRIIQGGHFLSDVVWSWGLIYLVGFLLWEALNWRAPKQAISPAGGES